MKATTKPSLKDMIRPEVVCINAHAKNRNDAIRTAGQILIDNGVVEKNYVEAMIRTCDELGPYIVLTPGVAIPHARPEDGAKGIGLSVVTLKEPVSFGNLDNDPVSIVIGFACSDHQSHVEVLSQLGSFLMDQERIQAVILAEKVEEVIDVFLLHQ